jgi:hypothetical protein
VGGGLDSRRLTVQLSVDGQVVAAQTGCGSELMYRWAWDTREYRGRRARFVIKDRATGGWGHMVVDEIVEWQRPVTAFRRLEHDQSGARQEAADVNVSVHAPR